MNPEIDMMYGWKELGIGSRVGVLEGIDYYQNLICQIRALSAMDEGIGHMRHDIQKRTH